MRSTIELRLRLSVLLGCTLWMTPNIVMAWAAQRSRKQPVVRSKIAPPQQAASATASATVVQGTIKAIARTPRPGAVPYKETIITLHLTGVKPLRGKLFKKEILVLLWGMQNNKWTRAASYRTGQTVRLSVQPWEKVENKYGGYNRVELEGEHIFQLDPFWGESWPKP